MELTEPQIDAPLIVAVLCFLALLGGSLTLWIRHANRPKNVIQNEPGASSWPIGWINFGIFICALVIAVFVCQSLASAILFSGSNNADAPIELTPWLAVFGVAFLQLPMLAVFYGARRFYPSYYASRLDSIDLSMGQVAKQAAVLFVMFLPVVWFTSLVWTSVLTALQSVGVVEDFEQQEIISLFQGGGDPLAIGLLIIMAVVLAPIVEELIFRGCIYRFLKSQTGQLAAQIISGALFSLMHANLLSFVPLMVVGILLARVYERTGCILGPIWFHAFFNGFSLLILFVTNLSDAIPK